jgi:hypothetical protein
MQRFSVLERNPKTRVQTYPVLIAIDWEGKMRIDEMRKKSECMREGDLRRV